MYRLLLLLIVFPLLGSVAVSQLQATSGVWLRGGIDSTTQALVSFGPTTDTRYVGLTFRDTLALPTGRVLRSRGSSDVAILVFDRQWQLVGHDHVGGPGRDSIVAMATTSAGNGIAAIAACGEVITPTTCRVGNVTLSGRGGFDIVLTSWNPDASPRWSRLDGGSAADLPAAIGIDPQGGVVVSATYVGATRIDTMIRRDAASTSMLLVRYSEQGIAEWCTSTVSSDDDVDVPRGLAIAGPMCHVDADRITAVAAAAGTVGLADMLSRDVNTSFETYPYTVIVDRRSGMPVAWNRINHCRGDSLAATVVGATRVSAIVEPRFCQPGTEPALRMYIGDERRTYVPGGMHTNVVVAAPMQSLVVLGGRYERSLLFDSVSRRPDLVAGSSSLQDGWVATVAINGSMQSALSVQAETWAQVTGISTRTNHIAIAAVAHGAIRATEPRLGVTGETGVAILLAVEPTLGIRTPATYSDADGGTVHAIWTLDGRYAGTDIRQLAPGVYVGHRVGTAPFPILVGIDD
jgi:hypothetical protein